MKALYELIQYLDEYIYDFEKEELIIKYSDNAEKADKAYKAAIEAMQMTPNEIESMSVRNYSRRKNDKWLLDIAIDCVRRMTEKDKEYVRKHMWTTEYHFGYAMGIRNKYIHASKKHHFFQADNVSSTVMEIIFSILNEKYDYRNVQLTSLYRNRYFQNIYKQYFKSEAIIFDEVMDQILDENTSVSSEEAIEILKTKIVDHVGKKDFIRIYKDFVKRYKDEEINQDKDKNYRFWDNEFSESAVLFPLEVNQIKCLHKLGLFREIERAWTIKSQKDCKDFIDEKLGLKEEYASFMAQCAWEAYDPISTGRWKELGLYLLDLDYLASGKLKKANIETIGAVYEKEINEIMDIIQDNKSIEVIKEWFKKSGIEWPKINMQ